jgi:unsaturated rhamnogalacturonyl hydrolase
MRIRDKTQNILSLPDAKTGMKLFSVLVTMLACTAFSSYSPTACKKRTNSAVQSYTNTSRWSVRMAQSVIKKNPESWMLDASTVPKWNYTQGLVLLAMERLWQESGDPAYYNYAKSYADTMINGSGTIRGYRLEEYNLDRINSGKILFLLYERTGDVRYKSALQTLRDQLKTHPRTSEGGFWHKKIYPWQMWLDGIYMAAPFYAEFAERCNEPASFDDIAEQIVLMNTHARDSLTGLLYHGWDESKQQPWADPVSGCSPNFWGRAMGWYAMAMVDVLDYLPGDHPGRKAIIDILNRLAEAVVKVQDDKTGLWYQVLDKGTEKGNYLESSASCMFVYSLLKASRLGYIDVKYQSIAIRGYRGIIQNFIRENSDGTISITNCCSVAGLGGNPYRDGSYKYYIGEPVRDDDCKATGTFIMASLEYEQMQESLLKH